MDKQTQTIKQWLGNGSLNVFGLPFAGKDTQGKKLAELFGGVMVSSGDILRHDHGNKKVQELMAAGEIIPSDLFEEIVLPYLSNQDFSGKPLILSEVGRMDGEQQIIMRATENSGHPTKAMILLKLSDEEVWKRFDASKQDHDRGERADDDKAVLQTRLDSYHKKVAPVIEWYRQQGLLIEIDGSLTREDVTALILDELESQAKN